MSVKVEGVEVFSQADLEAASRSTLKRVLIQGYCRGILPARFVTFVFRVLDLRAA